MSSFKKFFLKHWYLITCSAVILFAILLRFYNYPARIPWGNEDTRDMVIAMEALKRMELPLFSSFSSTGPYLFGPLYYWLNMISYVIFPFSSFAPFYLNVILSTCAVWCMLYLGYRVGGKTLSVLSGVLIAVSPQFIGRASFISQPSYIGLLSLISLIFFVLYYQTQKMRFAFLTGIGIGSAICFHFSAVNLLLLGVVFLITPKISLKKRVISILLFCIGLILPLSPFLYWDSNQSFANIRNFLDYILIGQSRIYVANSWRIFIFTFLIEYWSNVVGGLRPIALASMIAFGFMFGLSIVKKSIQPIILILGIIFFILLIVLRYYKGERFDGYVMYLAPFIILFCAWTLSKFFSAFQRNRRKHIIMTFISSFFLTVLIIGGVINAKQFILTKSAAKNKTYTARNMLLEQFPGKKFQIYDYESQTTPHSYPLGMALQEVGLTDASGVKIGIGKETYLLYSSPNITRIGNIEEAVVVTINSNDIEEKWKKANPPDIYDDLITRWTQNKLESNFSLLKYIESKIGISN